MRERGKARTTRRSHNSTQFRRSSGRSRRKHPPERVRRDANDMVPGTELAFEENVQYQRAFSLFGRACVDHKVARFRQVNMDDPHVHHDALEFPSGQIVMVTRLVAGQRASVLQLPASTRDHGGAKESEQVSSTGRIEA
jgi:hypothetical protein